MLSARRRAVASLSHNRQSLDRTRCSGFVQDRERNAIDASMLKRIEARRDCRWLLAGTDRCRDGLVVVPIRPLRWQSLGSPPSKAANFGRPNTFAASSRVTLAADRIAKRLGCLNLRHDPAARPRGRGSVIELDSILRVGTIIFVSEITAIASTVGGETYF